MSHPKCKQCGKNIDTDELDGLRHVVVVKGSRIMRIETFDTGLKAHSRAMDLTKEHNATILVACVIRTIKPAFGPENN
jgi:hypothetical protein